MVIIRKHDFSYSSTFKTGEIYKIPATFDS